VVPPKRVDPFASKNGTIHTTYEVNTDKNMAKLGREYLIHVALNLVP